MACFLNIGQTTEHEDIVGRWLKNNIRKYAFSQRTINEWNIDYQGNVLMLRV